MYCIWQARFTLDTVILVASSAVLAKTRALMMTCINRPFKWSQPQRCDTSVPKVPPPPDESRSM
jgi:hypothetical protein